MSYDTQTASLVRSVSAGSVAGCEHWDEMMEKLNTLADRLYAEDRGDEGALILGAMKRLLKQSSSIAHLQQNENSEPSTAQQQKKRRR